MNTVFDQRQLWTTSTRWCPIKLAGYQVAVNSSLKKEHMTSLGLGPGVAAMPAVGVVPSQKCQSISAQNSLKSGVLNNLPWLVPGHGFH